MVDVQFNGSPVMRWLCISNFRVPVMDLQQYLVGILVCRTRSAVAIHIPPAPNRGTFCNGLKAARGSRNVRPWQSKSSLGRDLGTICLLKDLAGCSGVGTGGLPEAL